MVDRGFHFGGPRFFLKILVDRGLVDRGSEKLSTTLPYLPQTRVEWLGPL